MSETAPEGVQVCVRVRPLNERELAEGNRVCVHFDDPTKQVVLTAVDRSTLVQLKGAAARGYAFDRRYSMDDSSDRIYRECVEKLVDNIFKGYNGTVLAYGQTGSGKTHTMSGGVGHYGVKEMGIIPRVIRQVFALVEQIKRRLKPGESVHVSASALEIYNEEFKDLSKRQVRDSAGKWDGVRKPSGEPLKLQEIPTGQGNRVRAEVSGLHEEDCPDGASLDAFFDRCFMNRSTSSTKLNDASSRSHALFTINVHRTIVSVGEGVDSNMKARVVTERIDSKLHLVDLAGSERVKRSGVSGKEFKEATHINQGLLALGNVIVALAEDSPHIPYRTSKLTRLIQDALGGNSLTVLITCISPSEADFEETNNTLKYANRACKIKNQPLPNKFLMLEEDLLPAAPGDNAGGEGGVISLAALLDSHMKQREFREKRDREKMEKELARKQALSKKKEQLMKTKGYQRLLASEYDRKLKEARQKGRKTFGVHETVDGVNVARSQHGGDGDGDAPSGGAGGFNFKSFLAAQGEDTSTPESVLATASQATVSSRDNGSTPGAAPASTPSKPMPAALAAAMRRKQERAQAEAQERLAATTIQERDADNHAEVLEDEPLAAEVEAQVREEAEREALKRAAEEAGETLDDEEVEAELSEDDGAEADTLDRLAQPRLKPLARFKVNKHDVVSVFKATTKEDFRDVVKLLPENTPLPASNKMTYLIARLEHYGSVDLSSNLEKVSREEMTMGEAVGPAVGCLMATFGTNMISSCIFDFDDPEDLELFDVEERIELWGLQIPHNSMRPNLKEVDPENLDAEDASTVVTWSSVDRLNMSVGLLFALCVNADESNVRCGFCVPRSQLLRRWQGAGVRMHEVTTNMRLIYPPHAHDFEYYKSSTVAYFLVDDVQEGLRHKLALCP